MKQRSKALLASAILAASPAAAAAAEPPLKTLPSQQEIWITGTIQRGNGQYAPGDYTSLRLDRPSTSPCNDKLVTDIVLGKANVPDPLLLLPYLGQRVAVRGRVICPDSGIRFAPTPDFVFPIY
ncbi:hypothetical protein R75461_05866 [Paraburkholderia nemoris]|uniref:hypothetical protein n=1 Tax=Paraburkholderia nemoris TaxID=2793076 RepID=UPI00190BD2E6|nr:MULTISPECIES: hypothetical protein [Paraburkholderia]MBK3786118.1 hypothetical protein [Paraburkholderia aspalathi]CAE6815869.1 hypothetical protein R75461_05866 [Paraburkholderia nemoris]